jgi:ATP/maltotriose-dependent transcriptional regulator MalT
MPAIHVSEPTALSLEQNGMLLSTKLFPPRLPGSPIERSRLLRELDAIHSFPLTLVSASAGSGKTTLLSAWAASRKPPASEESPQGVGRREAEQIVTWLSLDVLDNDPIRFWASVIAALRISMPDLGQTALALLHSPQSPPLSTILTALLNEIMHGSGDIILILDDYHVISDQAIHDSLLFLLDHLPEHMHLVLATRSDPELPLSRLRVRGQMIEIRSSDLRFTQEEATSFLLQCMTLPLSDEDVATLQHRTEGWIAGLQLAALSLRKQKDLSGWVSDFTGSYRYLLDYVQQDILAQLPIPLQHFLLQTSILTRMNADLCQAITSGPTRQASQEMLEEVERANLFVVPLDEQRRWYRYHDLFREALRARLKERLCLLTQEVEALSPDEEVSWKLIPLSFAFWLTMTLPQDSALLVGKLRSAKQWISEAGDYAVTFRVMTWLARAYIHAGQLHKAHKECLEAIDLLEQIGGSTAIAGYLFASLFDSSYAWNRLEEASEALHRLLRIAQDWQQVELLVMGERAAARLALARGDLETAQKAVHKAEAFLEQEEFANNVRWVIETRVQVWLAQGNLVEASNWATQITLSPQAWDPLRKWEVLLLVRVLLVQQQHTKAVETLERFREHLDQPADVEKTLEWMTLYVVALHHAGKSAQMVPIATRLLTMTEPEGWTRLYLDAGEPMQQALEALLAANDTGDLDTPQEDGNSRNDVFFSRPCVSRLLAAFEQEKRIRTLRATVQQEIQPEQETATVQRQGIEPLSRQELRVLRLLISGQTYAEMAETLIVSTNTIKTQVSSIYRKLGVSRRAEAISATQRLQIL